MSKERSYWAGDTPGHQCDVPGCANPANLTKVLTDRGGEKTVRLCSTHRSISTISVLKLKTSESWYAREYVGKRTPEEIEAIFQEESKDLRIVSFRDGQKVKYIVNEDLVIGGSPYGFTVEDMKGNELSLEFYDTLEQLVEEEHVDLSQFYIYEAAQV